MIPILRSLYAKFPSGINQHNDTRGEASGCQEGAEFDEVVFGEPDLPFENDIRGAPEVCHFVFEKTSGEGEDAGDRVDDSREGGERRYKGEEEDKECEGGG